MLTDDDVAAEQRLKPFTSGVDIEAHWSKYQYHLWSVIVDLLQQKVLATS